MAIPSVSPSKTGLQPSAGYIDRCWTVPFITGFICFLISIPQTNSGLLFVMFMDAFGVNRETAAWPKTIHTATTSLMGFALGAIQHKVSIHSTIMAGALLCPVAIIASAFVPNVAWMSVTLGLLYGAAFGALVIGTAVYIVSYFHEYRGFAMGIKFLGVSLSGIAGPSLVSLLASEHGLKGCFLITGGMMLHLIPLAFMLRYAKPVTCTLCRRRKSPGQTVHGVSTKLYGTTLQIQATDGNTCTIKQPDSIGASALGACDDLERRNSLAIPGTKSTMGVATKHSMCPTAPDKHSSAPSGFLREAIDVLRSPCFYVLLVAMVAADFTLPLFGSTIVDYAVDKGVTFNVAAQLVVYQCLGGFVGRLVIPLITDKLAHSRCPITAISLAALSLCFLIFPHITSLAAVAVVSFLTGVQQGYLNAFKSVLVAEYLGVHSVAVSWGFIGVATLPLVFCEPSIVGAFRDTRGSYDNLYRMCGAVNLFAAVLVSAQACFDARNRRNNVQISPTT